MIRYYCDLCGNEIMPDENYRSRVMRELGRVTIELMFSVDKTWNAGHVCHDCQILVVTSGKPVVR